MPGIRSLIIILLMSLTSLTTNASTHRDEAEFLSRSVTVNKTVYNYRVFAPKGWTKKKKWPVILFLHGAGERGDDNTAQTRVGIGPAILRQRDSFPFVVVMPQCPRDRWWAEPEMQKLALAAFDKAVKEFNGDRSRLYLTGLSMGGYGTWAIAASHPKKFAALAPVCGGIRRPPRLPLPKGMIDPDTLGDPYAYTAKKIGKTPVWVFHGGADPVVPVTESRKMVEALKAAGGNVRYTEYEGVSHNSWDKAYAEPEIFSWLLSKRR